MLAGSAGAQVTDDYLMTLNGRIDAASVQTFLPVLMRWIDWSSRSTSSNSKLAGRRRSPSADLAIQEEGPRMEKTLKLMFSITVPLIMLACGLIQPGALPGNDVSTIVAATLNAVTAAAPPPPTQPGAAGTPATFPGGGLVIPEGLATGASSEGVPAVAQQADMPWWDVAPAHVKVTLQGYALQDKFHEPQIVIYPAEEYASMNESAGENIQRLRDLLANPASLPGNEALPHITFFNAGAVFAAQVTVVPFNGGTGVRSLTEYAQYAAPINNTDLFYHFQGLTSDGKTYIVAILPVTAPLLAASSDPASVLPVGGIPFPGYESPDPKAFEGYYGAVTNLLNNTAAADFAPTLTSLDAMIGSVYVSQ
jgi:hypothetical protein